MIGRMLANQEGIGNRCGFILLARLALAFKFYII